MTLRVVLQWLSVPEYGSWASYISGQQAVHSVGNQWLTHARSVGLNAIMTETNDRIDRLRAVAATSHLRSPLARWLSANRDEFEKLLKDYRPRWEALVEQFGVEGLLDLPPEFASDDPHVRAATRRKVVKAAMQIWERVKHRVAPKRSPGGDRPTLAAVPSKQDRPPPNAPVQQQAVAVTSTADQHDLPPRRFGTATLRGHTPSAPPPPRVPIPVPEPDPDRADRVIAELLAGQVKGRFAPKIDDGE
jgi:hypothetical protein